MAAMTNTKKGRLEDLEAHTTRMVDAAYGLTQLVGWVCSLEEGHHQVQARLTCLTMMRSTVDALHVQIDYVNTG